MSTDSFRGLETEHSFWTLQAARTNLPCNTRASMDDVCDSCASISWDRMHTWQDLSGTDSGVDNRLELDTKRHLRAKGCRVCRAFEHIGGFRSNKRVSYLPAKLESFFRGTLITGARSASIGVLRDPAERDLRLSTYANLDLIKQLVRACTTPPSSEGHFRCKPGVLPAMDGFRVIDCLDSTIVPAPVSCQYLALSYVWGTDSTAGVEGRTSQLPHRIPRTIQDGIELTKALGFRYLWVDRYCIDQTSTEVKHEQIKNMQKIYACAQITLIAAAGKGPEYGLPGVTKVRESACDVVTVGKTTLVYRTTPDMFMARDLVVSSWALRAWTFQENFFSKRRLFCFDHGMVFSCTVCCGSDLTPEANLLLEFEPEASNTRLCVSSPTASMPARDRYTSTSDRRSVALEGIESYSNRSLTYDSDAVAAILGFLNFLADDPDNPIYHIWGVPVIPAVSKEPRSNGSRDSYEMVLFWYHRTPCRRRANVPSWSSLAWEGDLEHTIEIDYRYSEPREFPRFYNILISHSHDGDFRAVRDYVHTGQIMCETQATQTHPCF
jgi:hypothetical protein